MISLDCVIDKMSVNNMPDAPYIVDFWMNTFGSLSFCGNGWEKHSMYGLFNFYTMLLFVKL